MLMKPERARSSTLGRRGERHMRYRWAIVAFCVLGMNASAQQRNADAVMLGTGLHLEEVEENCKEAIKVYEKLTQSKGVDRSIAARAQLHIGICRERLGMGEARAAYQLVVEGYNDQLDVAATARARIGALSANDRSRSAQPTDAGIASRLVWTHNPDVDVYAMSADGRHVVYQSNQSGA